MEIDTSAENNHSIALDHNSKSMESVNSVESNDIVMDNSVLNQKPVTSFNNRPDASEGVKESASDVPVSLNNDETTDGDENVVKETVTSKDIPEAPTLADSSNAAAAATTAYEEDSVLEGETMDIGGNNLDEDELLKDDGDSSAKLTENEESMQLDEDSRSNKTNSETTDRTAEKEKINVANENDDAMDSFGTESTNQPTDTKDSKAGEINDNINQKSETAAEVINKESNNSSLPDKDSASNNIDGEISASNNIDGEISASNNIDGEISASNNIDGEISRDRTSAEENTNDTDGGQTTNFAHQDVDQDLSQDDEDVLEVPAVDPLAQTEDPFKDATEAMEVDNNDEVEEGSSVTVDQNKTKDKSEKPKETGTDANDKGKPETDKVEEAEKDKLEKTEKDKLEEVTEKDKLEQSKNNTVQENKKDKAGENESDKVGEKELAATEQAEPNKDDNSESSKSSKPAEISTQESGSSQTKKNSGTGQSSEDKSKEGGSATGDGMLEPVVEIEEEEEVCIIPDTMPRHPPGQDGAQKKDVTVLNEVPVVKNIVKKEKKDMPEIKQEGSTSGRPQRQAAKRAESQIKATVKEMELDLEEEGEKENEEDLDDSTLQLCQQCARMKPCKFNILSRNKVVSFLCSEHCANQYKETLLLEEPAKTPSGPPVNSMQKPAGVQQTDESGEFVRTCSQCSNKVVPNDNTLSWETMDFCNEDCLGKYQNALGSHCAYCKKAVQQASLGKYCVRFGYDIRQFCSSGCLEEYKRGLKVCSYCQKDISSSEQGFLAPVGDKGQFKDFCTQACMEKYDQMSNNQPAPPQMHPCDVCNNNKLVSVEVLVDAKLNKLCSEVCFAAFKFVNTINVDQCDMCAKYFDKANNGSETLTVFYEDAQHNFCCKTCMNVYILAKRKIVPCHWCKVKKYNFDMIKRVLETGQVLMMCSLNCLTLYKVSINAVSSRRIKCDCCGSIAQAQYHLTMSDATIRNFCTYPCVMNFQAQYNKNPITLAGGQNTPIPTGGPKRAMPQRSIAEKEGPVPVISSVTSLAANGPSTPPTILRTTQPVNSISPAANASKLPLHLNSTNKVQPIVNSSSSPGGASASPHGGPYIIIKERNQPTLVNKSISYRPTMHTKGVSCKPHACAKEVQTDIVTAGDGKTVLIPVPVPIYIPAPMHMFSFPTPLAVPIPLPVPVPIFIPTTKESAEGIMEEIKRIQEKIPTDPFEAELLMMAEMVAEDKEDKKAESSDSDDGPAERPDSTEPCSSTPAEAATNSDVVENNSSFGEDMLQIALKMATDMNSTAVDLEAELPPATISSRISSRDDSDENEEDVDDPEPVRVSTRGRKRPGRGRGAGSTAKRGRRASNNTTPVTTPSRVPTTPLDKPDANMSLKYTIGVNAYRQWVTTKNAELDKLAASSGTPRKSKAFKTEILQLTADELNYLLCLFVKEVRKPNGSEYAPDTIYYFCLGIQQYLFENSRIDNIFTDAYYDKFTECLNDVAKKFSEVYDDSQLIVTRVEEEHLWESKQLGAHSPHVLLSTLMFFNTKHFNLTTVEEHMQLSFSHIMKHWKRHPNQPGTSVVKTPGSRNVLLRFYPPPSALEGNPRKKRLYEQQENEENPLRCPVKLYEFYLSKCPESVKSRNDVFYLLPERSCVPDSPVWYSTMALGQDALLKMLHRVRMVKEINVALVNS